MIEHLVVWEIDIDADTPHDAALYAQKLQRDLRSIATVYEVTPRCSSCGEYHVEETVTIDIEGETHVQH